MYFGNSLNLLNLQVAPMLTDERPTIWHSDQYLREWAVDRGLDRYPKALVPLISASQSAPDTAEISFWDRGWPVELALSIPVSASNSGLRLANSVIAKPGDVTK